MDSTRRKKFEIEAIISPLAMASLQTQFAVGNRLQFGFLLGEMLISSENYRCDENIVPNTFYITSIRPVFDAASFLSDILKSNDKSLSKTFLKQVVDEKNRKREPIIGWYFQGNPDEKLKGKDYNLHVKLIRQYFLFNQRFYHEYVDSIAYHALLAAVVSYNKKRLSRDFSVGFQGFDERNHLRWYDVKVCVVDHNFSTRHTTDVCLVEYDTILQYIKEQLESDEVRNVFVQLQERLFTRPEPYCYQAHGNYINRCFDLLASPLKNACTSLEEPRDLKPDIQIFDYKAFDADPKSYIAAMIAIDKIERNLSLFDILRLLTDLDYLPSDSTAVGQIGQNSSQPSNPPILVNTLEPIQEAEVAETKSASSEKMNPEVPLTSESNDQTSDSTAVVQIGQNSSQPSNPSILVEALEQIREAEAAETKSASSEKMNPEVPLTSESNDQTSNSTAVVHIGQNSSQPSNPPILIDTPEQIQEAEAAETKSASSEKMNPEVPLTSESNDQNLQNLASGGVTIEASQGPKEVPIDGTEEERLGIEVKAAEPVHKGTTKASDDDSLSKAPTKVSRTKNRRRRKKKAASSASKEASSVTANSTQTSPEQNLKKQSDETCPFSNVPRDQLLVYSITPPKKSMEPLDSTLTRKSRKRTFAAAILDESNSISSSYTSEEEVTDSKPKEMQIKIISKNTSARVNIPQASTQKSQHLTDRIEELTKKRDKLLVIPSEINKSVSKNLGKSKSDETVSDAVDAGDTSSKHDEQNLASILDLDANCETSDLESLLDGIDAKEIQTLLQDLSQDSGIVTTVSSTPFPEVLLGETEDAAKTSSFISSTPACPDVTDSKLTPSPTTTPIPHEETSVASPAAQLADSSRKARSRKSKSKKPTGEPEKLPWPNSKDTYIIMPMAKNLTPVHEFWKYHLKPIPESLLTDLKCLRAWRKEEDVEAPICESSTNVTTDEQLLPDFQEAFGCLSKTKNRQSQDKTLPPITAVVAEPPKRSDSDLPRPKKEPSRLSKFLSARRHSLRRKSAFLSTRFTPLETVRGRRHLSIEYDLPPNKVASYTDDDVIPLCLLGDKFMVTATSAEEKYAPLSTISSSDSDDSDSETSTSGHSSEESSSS